MLLSKKPKTNQSGISRFAGQSWQSLACARYDAEQRNRFKTINRIIEESFRQPPINPIIGDQVVNIRAGIKEVALQHRVKAAGGKWNRSRQLWGIRYDRAVELGLEERIESGGRSINRSSTTPTK
ncbi:MAG: hypothetical protein M3X11_15000 [Acidobacteriota bacterium]|nr:hypothetical protein [Acidobacteriota bacterium]